jgi:DNA-binding CsgD family transcriptional regulator
MGERHGCETSSGVCGLAEAIADSLPIGVLLLDGVVVRWSNRAARAHLERSALEIRDGVIHAKAQEHEEALQEVLCRARNNRGRACGLIGSGRAALEVSATETAEGVVLFVTCPDVVAAVDTQVLIGVYKLTPAEARVAVEMTRSATVVEAARSLGSSVHTTRRHMKRVFAKLRLKRQSELTRRLTGGVAALHACVQTKDDPNG